MRQNNGPVLAFQEYCELAKGLSILRAKKLIFVLIFPNANINLETSKIQNCSITFTQSKILQSLTLFKDPLKCKIHFSSLRPPRNERRSSCTFFSCLQFWKSLPICDVTRGNDVSLINEGLNTLISGDLQCVFG